MVGVNNVVHDAICECFEGIMLEPCLLHPCFHVAIYDPGMLTAVSRGTGVLVQLNQHTCTPHTSYIHNGINNNHNMPVCMYIYIYIYIYTCIHILTYKHN